MTAFALAQRTRRWAAEVGTWLPTGRTLPLTSWQVRHRAVVVLLLVHAVALGTISALVQRSVADAATAVLVPGLGAYAASRRTLSRNVRSGLAAVSLMLTSAVVVHLMNGSIEAHFHFFAMIPIVALYEDWVPFGLAVAVVLVHHGAVGTLDPRAVYDHKDAWHNPWAWACVHAGFFAAACVGSVINWRLHERAREAERDLTALMRHRAHHDALTGLPNRTSLLDHALSLMAGDAASSRQVAVLMIDLDRFKEVNDVLGHASGDHLLAQVGPLLASGMRAGDVLARLGGDEFAAVLADADTAAAATVATRLLALLGEPIEVDGIELSVEASIGVVSAAVRSPQDINTLMRQADIAMYAAKQSRGGFAVYSTDQDTASLERLTVLSELRRAIDGQQIALHYQPKLHVATGKVAGVEALARWQHPTRGLLGPSEFIAAAESTGLIVPLTLQVVDQALAQLASWWQTGARFPVAVNLSPRSLAEPRLTDHVLAALDRHGLPPEALELEITEDTLAYDPDRALETLRAFDALGIRISIDDFGTGYSSMSRLSALPVSELKVDRGFVLDMLNNPDHQIVVRTVVELGHNLGLSVVAEGVEDEATLRALEASGCDLAQGYHIARPMPAEKITAWLKTKQTALTQ